MSEAHPRTDRRTRWTVVVAVILIHVVLLAGLIRAFTPRLAETVVDAVTRAFTITAKPPVPIDTPSPSISPSMAEPDPKGAAGDAGAKAQPREVAAPVPKVPVRSRTVPPVPGTGAQDTPGANAEGAGTGASGAGQGTGAGDAGIGTGGGGEGRPVVKIKGDINSAKDYPRSSRDLRIGMSVTIELEVGTDGRVKNCRVVQASPDAEADRITCELANRRFRFTPALDASGQPRNAVYRWRQRWFY
jgi:TonB family C-terminal domain